MGRSSQVRCTSDRRNGDEVTITYDVLGFVAEFQADLTAPFGGPSKITLSFDYTVDGVNRAIETDGITVEAVRALPIADARRRIEAHVAEVQTDRLRPILAALPERVETERDLARFASVYADLQAAGYRKALQHLTEATGMSHNTLNGRLRRARDRGLLTRPDETGRGQLTDKARELLATPGES